ncbi:MAG: hypothetical protein KDK38_13440 [Leptospiraceae bacterium]|nr:hypothetical protein [Leptospiraceae bacterium]
MSSEFLLHASEDFKKILSAEFAEDIEINGVVIQGIFDETYEEIDPDTGAVVMSKMPRCIIWNNDIPAGGFAQGSQLIIRGNTYVAKTIELDGQGSLVVKLHG